MLVTFLRHIHASGEGETERACRRLQLPNVSLSRFSPIYRRQYAIEELYTSQIEPRILSFTAPFGISMEKTIDPMYISVSILRFENR